MRRREFVGVIGGAAAGSLIWLRAARAQQSAKLPTIAVLGANNPAVESQWVAALVQRLRDLGWIEGRTVSIDYRWAEGRPERAAEIAAEFVRINVDIIVTYSTTPALAAKHATSLIPIVLATSGDPVGTGLIPSLARPGGNITGLSIQQTDLASKRLELLRELIPSLRRLAILANVTSPNAVLDMREAQAAASMLGLEVIPFEIRRAEDIASGFDALRGHAEALYVCSDPLVVTNRTPINTLAVAARLPTMHLFREHVEGGGLISYGADFGSLWRRAAELVDKILRGTKPADIPVEQPTQFDLVINLVTAKALGLAISPLLLARADKVIE